MTTRTYLSIGDVLSLLREEFPDVTISKIRFLESQGLVNPERSPSGYRKFYEQDVERLRWVLRQQREHFLPLKVIRDRLAQEGTGVPAGRPGAQGAVAQPAAVAAAVGAGVLGARGVADRAAAGAAPVRGNGDLRPARHEEPAMAHAGGAAGATEPAGSLAAAGTGAAQGRVAPGRPAPPAAGEHATGARPSAPGGRAEAPAWPDPAPGAPARAVASTHQPPAVGARAPEVAGGHQAPEHRAAGHQAPEDHAGGHQVPPAAPAPDQPPRPSPRREPLPPPVGLAAAHPAPAPGPSGAGPGPADAAFQAPAGVSGASLTLEELCAASGLSATEVASLEGFGLVEPMTVAGVLYYDEEAMVVAKLVASYRRYGIEPRHLRVYRNAVDREMGLVEQVVTPLLRQRNPEARQRAADTAADLAKLGQQLRGSLLRRELRQQLGG